MEYFKSLKLLLSVILSIAKNPCFRRRYHARGHGFFTSFRMTNMVVKLDLFRRMGG